MNALTEKSLNDLARSATAMGKIVEAHTDAQDVITKVVVELPEWVKDPQVRRSVAEYWQADGFIANVTKDGLLIVDGMRGSHETH
jgi:hypothetical protein